ncbi:MAG TPA: hypothetical protein ENH21_04860 [Chromatiales bacterium]|nr:hypothetical protein [Chromatiales bacterium]HEX22742.1 hypothetical protein [Chromatiales bacterium]
MPFVLVVIIALLPGSPVIAEDRLDMDAVAIKGSRELPKVLYIVPWKSTRLGALVAGAGSESFSAKWAVVDREVFRRQVAYYDLLYAD